MAKKRTYGDDFGSIWDIPGDAVDAVTDVATSAIDAVPGGKAVREAMGDVADSVAGQIILRAFATSLTGALAWKVGPQLATVAFAVPGLAKGDKFTKAWLDEFSWRVQKTAEI